MISHNADDDLRAFCLAMGSSYIHAAFRSISIQLTDSTTSSVVTSLCPGKKYAMKVKPWLIVL